MITLANLLPVLAANGSSISDSGYVRAGTKLLVKEARSNRVVVRAVTKKEEG